MRVRVRLFAGMAQAAGAREAELVLPVGATVRDAVAVLQTRYPKMRWLPGTMCAVNQEYVGRGGMAEAGASLPREQREGKDIVSPPAHPLRDGDELGIIPPVSGG